MEAPLTLINNIQESLPEPTVKTEQTEHITEPPTRIEENQEPVMTVCQNPMYKKYFSMLKMVNLIFSNYFYR